MRKFQGLKRYVPDQIKDKHFLKLKLEGIVPDLGQLGKRVKVYKKNEMQSKRRRKLDHAFRLLENSSTLYFECSENEVDTLQENTAAIANKSRCNNLRIKGLEEKGGGGFNSTLGIIIFGYCGSRL